MRYDMYKVIVERPRRRKGDALRAARLRDDRDGPMHLGMRAGYGRPDLNENLSPLRRYLCAQVGRPWNTVYSEISRGIDRRNIVQQHICQHIEDFIAIKVERQGESLIDLRHSRSFWRAGTTIHQELYVDPGTGLIRRNEAFQSWRRVAVDQRRALQAETEMRRRMIDDRTQLHRLAGAWFLIQLEPLPDDRIVEAPSEGGTLRRRIAEPRFDVVLRRSISKAQLVDAAACRDLYGSDSVYAVLKRQLSRRELKDHGLLSTSG